MTNGELEISILKKKKKKKKNPPTYRRNGGSGAGKEHIFKGGPAIVEMIAF